MKNYIDLFETSLYSFPGEKSVIGSGRLGIASDICALLTPPERVSAMQGFQGCPYSNTAFDFDVRIDGEAIKTSFWRWLPNAILRRGRAEHFSLETVTALIAGERSVIMKLTVKNLTDKPLDMPLSVEYRGRTVYQEVWNFNIPAPAIILRENQDNRELYTQSENILSSVKDSLAYRLTSSLKGMRMFKRAYLWENDISIGTGESLTFYISAHIGKEEETLLAAESTAGHYEEKLEGTFDYLQREAQRIENNLPRLKTSDPALDKFYYRSLVTYILCRWENPDLCVSPYYSTGGVNGSCMCSYLWDYCGGLMLHPIYDPEGNKKQLISYLENDLTKSYALNPVTGKTIGPWYQINQEKIILMVYHHIRQTGDKAFLFEQVGDRTVLDWMKYHAYVCDDLSGAAKLYDYGEGGKHHLELYNWGNRPYDGIIPDLNARRYMNYMRVYELTVLAGEPDERLPKRAAELKEALKPLWNEEKQWYDFIDIHGERGTIYTIQMFKFIDSGVIDEHERRGLVSHINEKEFLSKFGMHSLSKADPEYDQDDIDNGGGGSCTHFVMQTCAQLYATGYDKVATDILRRVYWWGERLPYLGDSCLSNRIKNNDYTFLQGDISSVSCAQMIFFYIFGIKPDFNGNIVISPVKNRPAESMRVDNARIAGKTFSVDINGDSFSVEIGGKIFTAKIGEGITI